MIKSSITVAVFALLGTGCGNNRKGVQPPNASPQSQTPTDRPSSIPDDIQQTYAVYDALLGKRPPGRATSGLIAIADLTRAGQSCVDHPANLDPQVRDAFQDYERQNADKRPLIANNLDLNVKVLLLPSSDLDAIFSSQGPFKGWETFHKKYPGIGGFVTLSAFGFNAGGNVAVVYSSASCGSLCGTGGITALTRKDGV